MNYVGQLAESVYVTVKELYEGLNPATLSGGIDVLVVKQPDGSFLCSPFHVRFGKLGVLRSREKVVDIEINGEPVDLQMKLGDNGEAFFVQQLETNDEEIPTNLYTSPIPPECSNEVLNDPLLDLIENVHKHSSETTMSQRKKRRRRKKVKKKDKLILTTTPATSSEELEEVQAEIVVEDRPMTELSSTRDQIEEDVSTQHKDSYLYLNMESLHRESFYTAEDELVGPKDSFICSDVEFSHNESSLSSEYLTSIRSDSELEIKFGSQNTTRTEPQMQWHWGRLPQVVKGEHVKVLRSSQSNTSINPLLCKESICQIATSDLLANSETILQDGQNISGAPSLLKLPSYSGSTRSLGLIKLCPSSRILTTSKDSLAQNSEEGRTENIQEMNSSFDSTVLPQGLTGQEGSDSSKQKKERKDTQRRSQHSKSSDTYLEGLSSLNSTTFHQSEINLQSQQWSKPCFSESNLLQPTVMGDDTTALLSDASLEQENNVELSLCGGLAENRDISTEKFAKYSVSYKNLADNPGILDDPNLVVKIGKKCYNWAVAAPMILSLQAFQKSLPKSTVDKLVKEKMPKKTGRWWFSWGIKDSASEKNEVQEVASTSKKSSIQQGQESLTIEEDPLSIPVVLDSPSPPQSSFPNFKKSLRLSSDQLRDLNLREGANDVVFSVTTQYQGTCRCHANIYLWNWYDKVVVSDIDGTITRSDALGHILPQLGKDWTHRGIIKLYHKIHLNGYKFLYCSARSIGLADLTKGYLKWVHEHDCGLPKGPLLLTPSSLFSALHREVIEKKPEVFKIACLTDIRNLFLPHGDPFFAGFGNRASDVDAYLQAGISKSRIFTINPQGELVQEHIKNHKTTYDRLRECVELIFPPIKLGPSVELVKPEYSQFCYWRNPLVKVHPRDLILD